MSTETPSDTPDPAESYGETDAEDHNTPLLEVENLKRYFEESEGFLDRLLGGVSYVKAVDGVDLTVHGGETVAVVGESGCGKTTLGQTILNLHKPTEGTVKFKGEDIAGLSEGEMRPYRQDMQMIFQDPLSSLNPRQSVGDILRAPFRVHNIGENKQDRTERAEQLLERVGLKPSHLDRYPHQFSGGQQQRIGIARALALEPDLLIADEPVSALDVSIQAQVLQLLEELQEELGLSILVIAHDLSVVRHISDRVAVMYLGEIVETAPTEQLFENPKHPYTKSLLSAVPRIDPEFRTDRVILEGSVPSPTDPPDGCRFHTRCPVIIPPDDWTESQKNFKSAYVFRTRLTSDELYPESIRNQLELEGEPTSDEAVKQRIIETAMPGNFDELSEEIQNSIEEATRLLIDGDKKEAKAEIRQAIYSPCEKYPRKFNVSDHHMAACHRIDPNEPGEPIWPD